MSQHKTGDRETQRQGQNTEAEEIMFELLYTKSDTLFTRCSTEAGPLNEIHTYCSTQVPGQH